MEISSSQKTRPAVLPKGDGLTSRGALRHDEIIPRGIAVAGEPSRGACCRKGFAEHGIARRYGQIAGVVVFTIIRLQPRAWLLHMRGRRLRGVAKHGDGLHRGTALLVFILGFGQAGFAQDSPSLTAGMDLNMLRALPPEQQQQLLQQMQRQQNPALPETIKPSVMPAREPVLPAVPAGTANAPNAAEPSALERVMSARAGQTLTQYGYDQIANGTMVQSVQVGAVADGYVMGAGDQIAVSLRGQENNSFEVTVDRDGRIIMPRIAPVFAAGRSYGAVRADLEQAVRRAYVATNAYISLKQARQIGVVVVGEVNYPGAQVATGLSTVLDLLNLAGGIRKTGSLRDIAVVRGNRTFKVDLYAMLRNTGPVSNLTLAEGDRIVVPAIGQTVAIAGQVKRPGIYELPAGAHNISTDGLLDLANGLQLPGLFRRMLLKGRPDGKRELVDASTQPVQPGEILFIERSVDRSLGNITLEGTVRVDGRYALDKAASLRALLPSADAFAPDAYMLLGYVIRTDPGTMVRSVLPFSPLRVVRGRENLDLASDDIVHVMSMDEMQGFAAQGAAAQESQANLVSTVGNGAPPQPNFPQVPHHTDAGAAPDTPSANEASVLGKTLLDYRVDLIGAVHRPGVYLVSPDTTLSDLLDAAGGLGADVDSSRVELTRAAVDNATGSTSVRRSTLRLSDLNSVVLQRHDQVRFMDSYSNLDGGLVTLEGEVRHPGTYPVMRGEKLSDVIMRAGGFSDAAYPYGAVFTRLSAARVEQEAMQREANDLQSALLGAVTAGLATATIGITSGGTHLDASTADFLKTISQTAQRTVALGRITVQADPAILAAHPERDIMLEPGDRLIIPRRPGSVYVMGEVRNPGGFLVGSGLTVDDYVKQAGGATQFADDDSIYVIYPDGTSRPMDTGWLTYADLHIPPGSTIVVPRDLIPPLNWLQILGVATQLTSQLTLTAASLAVIHDN